MRILGVFVILALVLVPSGFSQAVRTIIDDWKEVVAPPPPALKPVTVDPRTTALLVLDFVNTACNMDRRPRCVS